MGEEKRRQSGGGGGGKDPARPKIVSRPSGKPIPEDTGRPCGLSPYSNRDIEAFVEPLLGFPLPPPHVTLGSASLWFLTVSVASSGVFFPVLSFPFILPPG